MKRENQKIPTTSGVYFFLRKGWAKIFHHTEKFASKGRDLGFIVRPALPLGKAGLGRILYIGKAVNLRARLNSYKKTEDPRIRKMLKQAAKIAWQETGSEIEALILESQLIKKHHPPFNVMLRDDKQYFYVGFTKDMFPRLFLTHQPAKKRLAFSVERLVRAENRIRILNPKRYTLNANYVGPFTDGSALKTTLRLLRRIFPYCTCKQKHNNYCLNYHIGKCLGFCCLKNLESRIKDQELRIYENNIRAIQNIFSGKRTTLVKKLTKEMEQRAKVEDFEGAALLRNKITRLSQVFQNAQIIRDSRFLLLDSKSELGSQAELISLAKFLNTKCSIKRMEGYDIANIQGKFATGAMAVFTSGKPDKNQYRKFRIRTGRKPNDIAMLREILTRRFNHPEWPWPDLIIVDGGKAQLSAAKAVISNFKPSTRAKHGAGLVPHRNEVSGARFPISKKIQISIIALTKDEKHRGTKILVDAKKAAMPLSDLPLAVRNLILQVGSEAHRFAIGYCRKLHRLNL